MKFAVVSDIHGNLEALRITLDYLHSQQISKIICLGDVVGYGPNPNECVELVQQHCAVCLMGNHDHAVAGLTDIDYFNEYAREAILWTRKALFGHLRAYLANLPFTYEENDFFCVHSSPLKPAEWNYIFSIDDAHPNFKAVPQRVIFIGHSHVPTVFSFLHGRLKDRELRLDIDRDRYIINVGSIGQPRDGDPRACCVVVDEKNWQIRFVRLSYPVETTYRKIIEAGLPPLLARRLLVGQ